MSDGNKNQYDTNSTHIENDDTTHSALKPWEKPGLWGKTRRSWRTIQRYIWDDPDKSKEDKWFLFKLDLFLLSYTCLGYFVKNLDQANISNAYVSGMKEALDMKGNDLTYAGNVFTAGYVVGQFPAVIFVTRVRPSLLVPTLEVLWAVFTFCCAAIKTTGQLYALRFLIALCESAYFPVITYLICSWYTKKERAKRVTLFYSTASLASMFSGYLQAGAYDNLGGKLGHAGWQWLFIICGVISLAVGFIGYFFCPDFPETTRAFYLTKEETAWAKKRLLDDGLAPLGASPWDRTKIFRIAKQWQFYVLPLGYFFIHLSLPSWQPGYALYLKAEGHSVYEINVWPTGQIAVGFVVQVISGMLSDSPLLKGRRWETIVFMQTGSIVASIILTVWDVPIGAKYFAFYIVQFSAGAPGTFFAWFPDLVPDDHEFRGFLIASSNIFAYVHSIWYTLAFWRTEDAPQFQAGYIASIAFGVGTVLIVIFTRYMEIRDEKIRAKKVVTELDSPIQPEGSGRS